MHLRCTRAKLLLLIHQCRLDITGISATLTLSAVNLRQGTDKERDMETVYLVCAQVASQLCLSSGGLSRLWRSDRQTVSHPLFFRIGNSALAEGIVWCRRKGLVYLSGANPPIVMDGQLCTVLYYSVRIRLYLRIENSIIAKILLHRDMIHEPIAVAGGRWGEVGCT